MDSTIFLMDSAENKIKDALEDLERLKDNPNDIVAGIVQKAWKDVERVRRSLHSMTMTVADMKGEKYGSDELESGTQRSRKGRAY